MQKGARIDGLFFKIANKSNKVTTPDSNEIRRSFAFDCWTGRIGFLRFFFNVRINFFFLFDR